MEKLLPGKLLELRHAAAHPFGYLYGKLAAFVGIHVHTLLLKLFKQLQDLLPAGSHLNPFQECG
jgi:hypothetical protein